MNRISLESRRCVFIVSVLLLGIGSPVAKGQVLYFSQDGNVNGLFKIDTTTGQATLVGAGITGTNSVTNGLTESANPTILFGSDANGLRRINADGSGSVLIGSMNIEGLAFDQTSGLLYGTANNSFFTVDQSTGAILTSLLTPGVDLESLAWVPGFIYGIDDSTDNLHRYDIAMNTWAVVGNTGANFDNMGLAYDPVATVLYAVGEPGAAASLYKIDPTTGVATVVGPLNLPSGVGRGGLAYVPAGVIVTESGGSTNVTEGGPTDTYTVALSGASTAPVTITINAGTQVTVLPATLTFTPANWNVAQTVTVTAVSDALVEGAHTGTITHTATSTDASYNGIAIANIVANITDTAPPPPTPGGGIAEGNYPGSKGLANGPDGEGTFGFGRQLRTLQPFLKGPHRDPNGNHRVFNAAHQQPQPTADADGGLGVLGWGLIGLAILAPVPLVFGRRRPV